MLQSIRDHAKGWLAYVIVGFISIPFVFWGVQEYLGAGGNRLAAEINGVEIPVQEFQRALKQRQQQIRSMFGANVPAALIEGGAIQQTVINDMIKNELLRQYANDAGFKVGDRLLRDEIKRQPYFQKDGKFSAKKYEQLLAQQRMTKAGFEQQIRAGLQDEQFKKAIVSSTIQSNLESKDYLMLKHQERDIEYLEMPLSLIKDQVSVSDEAIAEYYNTHKDKFTTDEKVKLQYILLDPKDVEQQINIPDGALLQLYDQGKSQYRTVEARHAAHILLKPADGSEAAQQKTEEKLNEVLARIKNGEDFGAIAQEISEDGLSKEKQGDLGFISVGDMDPVFEKALFALNVGEVSEPVKSSSGIHLIKFIELRPARQKTFDEVHDQVERTYRENEADKLLIEKSEQLLTLTYETPDSLDVAADALGVKVQETDWISHQGGAGLGKNPDVIKAAFSEEVLNQHHNSDVIETQEGQQIVIRVDKHQLAEPKPLESVKLEIENILRQAAEKEKIQEMGKSLLAQLNAGKNIAEVAASLNLETRHPGFVTRESRDIPAEILQRAFKLKAKDSAVVPSGVILADGGYGLFVLKGVKQSADNLSNDDIANAELRLRKALARREFDAVYRALESRAKIQVFTENLAQ